MIKLLTKTLFLFLLIFCLQYSYYHVLSIHIPSIKKTSRMDFRFNNEVKDPFEIAFIASSINFTTAKSDTDKRDIAQIMEDKMQCQVLDISRGGNNIELYDEITKRVLNSVSFKPKLVYEISIRTFSQVYNEPANSRSLKDDEVIFRDNFISAFYHALNVFKYGFGLLSQKEFNHMDVYLGTEYLTSLDQFMKDDFMPELTVPHKKFLINYMSNINKENPKAKALRKLAQYIKTNDLEVLFLIPPENVRKGLQYFPEKFQIEFDKNIAFVKSILDEYDCKYLDLSHELDSQFFTHSPEFPNGHLTQEGRIIVANKISSQIDCMIEN